MTDFNALRAPFPPAQISWRIGTTTADKKRGLAFAYIDARDVMERLDAVVGPANWQCKYSHANGKTVCDIGINVVGGPMLTHVADGAPPVVTECWVWKADGAGDSDMEAEKGALSDAFKRAAVRWGIGRYLYDVPTPWVAVEAQGRSYVIADSERGKLAKLLAGAASDVSAQPEEPTESEQRIFDRMKGEIAKLADLKAMDAWRTKPENVTGFKDLPQSLRSDLQSVMSDRRATLSNLRMAG